MFEYCFSKLCLVLGYDSDLTDEFTLEERCTLDESMVFGCIVNFDQLFVTPLQYY